MAPHVTVDSYDGRPVVIKAFPGEGGVQRCAEEGDRLRAARHPGVVELVATNGLDTGPSLTLAWAGGRTLETERPALATVAALLASLCSTVADLHGLGIVHGRIDPSHVVVDGEGRPRLCGFGPDPDPSLGAADDVGALGSLLARLVDGEPEVEPIPEQRWGRRRWRGFVRRSLQTLADQATDDDPIHRPTARQLAKSIAETVPEARLARPEPARAPFPKSPDVRTATIAPAAVAFDEGCQELTEASTAQVDPADDIDDVGDDRPDGTETATEAQPDVRSPTRLSGTATFLGMHVTSDPSPGDGDQPNGDSSGDVTSRGQPPRPIHGRPTPTRRHAGRAAAVAAVVLALAVVAAPWLRSRFRPSGSPVAIVADESGTASTSTPLRTQDQTNPPTTTAPTTSVPGCPSVRGPGADLDGDGCPDAVQVRGTTLSAGEARFRIGSEGDRLAVGDWTCRGTATAALVRPRTGEVFVFSTWAGRGQAVSVAPVAVVPGVSGPVEAIPSRCGPLRVRTGGRVVTVPTTSRAVRP